MPKQSRPIELEKILSKFGVKTLDATMVDSKDKRREAAIEILNEALQALQAHIDRQIDQRLAEMNSLPLAEAMEVMNKAYNRVKKRESRSRNQLNKRSG